MLFIYKTKTCTLTVILVIEFLVLHLCNQDISYITKIFIFISSPVFYKQYVNIIIWVKINNIHTRRYSYQVQIYSKHGAGYIHCIPHNWQTKTNALQCKVLIIYAQCYMQCSLVTHDKPTYMWRQVATIYMTMTLYMTVTHKRRGILKSLPSCTPSEFSFASVLPCKNSLSESASIVHNEMSLQFVVVLSLNIWVREGITTKYIITQCNVYVQIIQ